MATGLPLELQPLGQLEHLAKEEPEWAHISQTTEMIQSQTYIVLYRSLGLLAHMQSNTE